MGDVVLQTATINWLRCLLGKSAHFSFITSSEFMPLLEEYTEIDSLISFNRKGGETWSDLKRKIDLLHQSRKIDLIFDLHGTLRSWRLRLSYWKIPALTIDKRRWERFLLTKIKSTKIKKIFDKKFFSLEPQVFRIINDFKHLFDDSSSLHQLSEVRFGPHGEMTQLGPSVELNGFDYLPESFIVLAPSASFVSKRWPVERFVDLTKELIQTREDDVIVIIAGPGDDFCDAFNVIDTSRLINLQGKTTLKQTMGLLSRAKICIGNDSGINHIAEAYGVPCLTIFGPTDPRFGFSPHGRASKYLSRDLSCKPCSTTGKKSCYRDRLYCMEEITVKDVLTKSLEILNS